MVSLKHYLTFLKAKAIRHKLKEYRGLLSSYTDLAEYYQNNDPNKARSYLDSLYDLSKKINSPVGQIKALKGYMLLEPENIQYKDRYIFLKDSLYQQELKVKTQFAHLKYLDEQEKKQLVALKQETATQEIKLVKSKNRTIVLVASIGFLIIIGIISSIKATP